ncbi:hypothetical protein [Arthrobacter alpinus]|uniref:hypothetical protein n=1 Tax=Arthrobacter alpinus TaxID=656366 RepID=UPI000A6AAE59|nr:hypothetical protein [Arthrobacter alpinus]
MKIEVQAADKKTGMTLAEMQQFLNQCDQLGIDPRSTVNAVVGFVSQVKSMKCGNE